MASTSTKTQIAALEKFLSSGAGVRRMVIDGTTVEYDRAQAQNELNDLRRNEARSAGRKPRVSTINLGTAW